MPHLILFPALLLAQVNAAALTGSVWDSQSRLPIAGALVALPELGRVTFCDAQGRYRISDVPAGPQHVTVRSLGYETRMLHAFIPGSGVLEINIALHAVPISLRPVEVRPRVEASAAAASSQSSTSVRSISIATIRNDPLQTEPDVFTSLAGAGVVLLAEAPKGVNIQGGAADQTAFLLDGIPVLNPYHAAGMFSAWNPDALSALQVSASAPLPQLPDVLSGAVVGLTRTPGTSTSFQGSASTSQARLTVDGPLAGGARYLLSMRSGFPALIAPRGEASYVRGGTSDGLAKVELDSHAGRFRLLGYQSDNELNTSTTASDIRTARNAFEWESHSAGLDWERELGRHVLHVLAWSADGSAQANWSTGATTFLQSERRDAGLLATIEQPLANGTAQLGARVQRMATSYSVRSDSVAVQPWRADTRLPTGTAFLRYARAGASGLNVEASAAVTTAAGDVHFSPRLHVSQQLGSNLTLSAGIARTQQFAQSLRNAESVVGHIFPVDVFVAAGADGVPVASNDQAIAGAELRTNAGITVALRAFAREAQHVLLVAPVDENPFSIRNFATGGARAQGVSVDASYSSARIGLSAKYGWQHVRYTYGAGAFSPEHAATHLLDVGAIYFPAPSASLRIGASAAAGRRTTPLSGALEWESCNLIDQGCEFSGSPGSDASALGATRLPAYLRVDVGARKHWHVRVGERSATLAAFGSVTNLLARKNVLTYGLDPATGARTPVEMRPLAPLVLGIDWRF